MYIQTFASGRTFLKCEIAGRNFYEIMDSLLSYLICCVSVENILLACFYKGVFSTVSVNNFFENNARFVNYPD